MRGKPTARRSFDASTLPIAKLRSRLRDYADCAKADVFSSKSIYPLFLGGVCDTNTPSASGRSPGIYPADGTRARIDRLGFGRVPRDS
jgi:hypothetical protein